MRAIQKLKEPVIIKPPKITKATPCAIEIAGMFNCWRQSGVDSAKCAEFVTKLGQCMTVKKAATKGRDSTDINYWLKASWKQKVL